MNLHPSLYKHQFYEHTTALEYSRLPNGSIFDVTSYRDGQWIKSRFRKDEDFKMVKKLNENGEPILDHNGKEVEEKKFFAVVFKTDSRPLSNSEVREIEKILQRMDQDIETILSDTPSEIYEASMQYRAAWSNHTLRDLDMDTINKCFTRHMTSNLNVDEIRSVRNIIMETIWNNASEGKRQHYLDKLLSSIP